MVVNEGQDDWEAHMLQLESSFNKYFSATNGLAPNEVGLVCRQNRLSHRAKTAFEQPYTLGHRSLDRDQLVSGNLAGRGAGAQH